MRKIEVSENIFGFYQELDEIIKKFNQPGIDFDQHSASKIFSKSPKHLLSYNYVINAGYFKKIFLELSSKLVKYQPGLDEKVASISRSIFSSDQDTLGELLKSSLVRKGKKEHSKIKKFCFKNGFSQEIFLFLITNSLKPLVVNKAQNYQLTILKGYWERKNCPFCGWEAAYGEIDKFEQKILTCSFCSTKWKIRTRFCSFCGNQEKEKLKSFLVENDGQSYQLDTCDNCQKYLKIIVKPLKLGHQRVDDFETIYLDLIAQNYGYIKNGNRG